MRSLVVSIILLFLVSQFLGIYVASVIVKDYLSNPYVRFLIITTDSENPFNAVLFSIYVLFGALIMFFLIRWFGIHPFIFRIMEFLLLSTATSIVFYSFFRIGFGYEISMIGGMIGGIGLAFSKLVGLNIKNIAAVLATAGVGVIFGISLTPVPVILFLLFLSVYDYVAVFKTRHMVEFAKFILEKNLAFTVTAKGVVEGRERRIDLGTGDLIAPIMFEVSALSYISFEAAVFVFVGALLSLAIFMFFVWKRKTILPALPPLVFGMLASFLIGMLLGIY